MVVLSLGSTHVRRGYLAGCISYYRHVWIILPGGIFPLDWFCFCIQWLYHLHLVGTVIHDASHNAAHSNRVVNAVLGHGSALMLGFTFPVFTRVHLQHHAQC